MVAGGRPVPAELDSQVPQVPVPLCLFGAQTRTHSDRQYGTSKDICRKSGGKSLKIVFFV